MEGLRNDLCVTEMVNSYVSLVSGKATASIPNRAFSVEQNIVCYTSVLKAKNLYLRYDDVAKFFSPHSTECRHRNLLNSCITHVLYIIMVDFCLRHTSWQTKPVFIWNAIRTVFDVFYKHKTTNEWRRVPIVI